MGKTILFMQIPILHVKKYTKPLAKMTQLMSIFMFIRKTPRAKLIKVEVRLSQPWAGTFSSDKNLFGAYMFTEVNM